MENTIFFGNGINRLSASNISWNDVLTKIKGSRKFEDNTLPNTMIYERIVLEKPAKHIDVLHDEFEVKEKIADFMGSVEEHEFYSTMYDLNAQNYLTTNYDYAFIKTIIGRDDINTPIHEYSLEDVYSIRRLKRISNAHEQKKHFWQIHGEIGKPATIMLGLDHYCGSIGKIDGYIKGRYNYRVDKKQINEESLVDKFENYSFTNSSWVELFFTTDVHIFGFSLDYSEIDLWWIINKRARMLRSELKNHLKNKIVFYTNRIDDQKKALLNIMNVEVQMIKVPDSPTEYSEFYNILFKSLKRNL